VDYVVSIAALAAVIAGAFVYAAGVRRRSAVTQAMGLIVIAAGPLVWIFVILLSSSGE
jgi:hypothetical protein